MAAELQATAAEAKARVENGHMHEYDGYTVLDRDEGLWVSAERLREAAPLLSFLTTVDDGRQLTADEVHSGRLSFHAIGLGPDHDRAFFVRARAGLVQASGKILGLVGAELRPVGERVLVLDRSTDFVLLDAGAVVFNAREFERYIQDPHEIEGAFDQTVDQFGDQLSVDAAVLGEMKAKGAGSIMLRGRLRSIVSRPYFPNLTLDLVREKIAGKGWDPARFIEGGHLKFTAADTMRLLKLLDQKVWLGDFDGTVYTTSAAMPERG